MPVFMISYHIFCEQAVFSTLPALHKEFINTKTDSSCKGTALFLCIYFIIFQKNGCPSVTSTTFTLQFRGTNHARNPHGLCTHYEGVPLLHIHEMRSGSSCPEVFGLWISYPQNSFVRARTSLILSPSFGRSKFHGSVKNFFICGSRYSRASFMHTTPSSTPKLISRILISSLQVLYAPVLQGSILQSFWLSPAGLVMQRSKGNIFLMLPLSSARRIPFFSKRDIRHALYLMMPIPHGLPCLTIYNFISFSARFPVLSDHSGFSSWSL